MEFAIQIGIIISLLLITIQDIMERKVYVFLFAIAGILTGFMHFWKVYILLFFTTSAINLTIVFLILFFLHLYARLKLKKKLSSTFGLGDGMFFTIMAIAFPTTSFLVLFCFSVLFSFFLFLFLKKKGKAQTVPLAGLQALFLALIYSLQPFFGSLNLYSI